MLTAAKPTKIEPIFAVIEAHRKATAVRYPILETMMTTRDGTPERRAIGDAHDKAADVEIAATVKLNRCRPSDERDGRGIREEGH